MGTTAPMSKTWQTRLIHSDATVPEGYRSLVTPVYRGSTTIFASASAVSDEWDQERVGYTYGLYGTPTSLELAARICELESGLHTILTPGGQSAISLIDFALLKNGDHILVPRSVYGPNRQLTTVAALEIRNRRDLLRSDDRRQNGRPDKGEHAPRLDREPRLGHDGSPGRPRDRRGRARARRASSCSTTPGRPACFSTLSRTASTSRCRRSRNTSAATAICCSDRLPFATMALYQRLGAARQVIGCAVSPDDCSLALRGLQTLGVRLSAVEDSALAIARWLSERPEVELVLHPALPSCPGHELWKRDFTGSSGVFSFVFAPGPTREQVFAFVDALQLFEIGYSWAGTTSLAVAYTIGSAHGRPPYDHRLVRFSIGLESTSDLMADIERALQALRA